MGVVGPVGGEIGVGFGVECDVMSFSIDLLGFATPSQRTVCGSNAQSPRHG